MFSRAAGREGCCRQMSLVCVGSTRSVQPHWVCPLSRHVCFPRPHCSGSRLLYREQALSCVHFPGPSRSGSVSRVLPKGTGSVGPVFCAFPSPSSSSSQELAERTLPGCGAPYPLRSPSLSFCACQLGAPCVYSGELVSGCDPPDRGRPSRIPGSLWLKAGSLFAVW